MSAEDVKSAGVDVVGLRQTRILLLLGGARARVPSRAWLTASKMIRCF